MPGKQQSRKEGNKSAYIVIHDGKALNVIVAMKQDNASNNSGQHVFPGGTDRGQTLEENAEKELEEELGISIIRAKKGSYLVDNKGGQYPIIGSVSKPEIGSAIGAIFLEVSSLDLNSIVSNFNKTEEIASIEVCSRDEALTYFQSEHDTKDKRRQTGWFTTIASNLTEKAPVERRGSKSEVKESASVPFWGGKPVFDAQKESYSSNSSDSPKPQPKPMPKSSKEKSKSMRKSSQATSVWDTSDSSSSDSPKPKPKSQKTEKGSSKDNNLPAPGKAVAYTKESLLSANYDENSPVQSSHDESQTQPSKMNRSASGSDSDDELKARARLEVQTVREAEKEQKLRETQRKIAKNQNTDQGREPEKDQSRYKGGEKPRWKR